MSLRDVRSLFCNACGSRAEVTAHEGLHLCCGCLRVAEDVQSGLDRPVGRIALLLQLRARAEVAREESGS